jgi:multiple sugar transport system permease protein
LSGPGWRREQQRSFALGLIPALLVLAAITLGPTIYLVVTSLTPLDPVHPHSATDFSDPARNYRALIADMRFLNSLWVQVKLSAATVAAQLAIGLGVALLLKCGFALSGGGAHCLHTADGVAADCCRSCLEGDFHP